MPSENILQLLIQQRDRLNRAIEVLQGPTKRRGRPSKSSAVTATLAPRAARKRSARTAAQRKAQSARMKKFWATRKKQKSAKE